MLYRRLEEVALNAWAGVATHAVRRLALTLRAWVH